MNRLARRAGYTLAAATVIGIPVYANSTYLKELAAREAGRYITRNLRFTVIFEEAGILGLWSRFSFKRCFVLRRPQKIRYFAKGSQLQAAAESGKDEPVLDDGNYTQYDLTFDEINVEISLLQWLNGKGILKSVSMLGVRGVVDRTHVKWDPNDDARNYLNVPSPGDFNIGKFEIEDLLVTLYQPGGFRPFNISIYDCKLDRLRQNWLLVDFLLALNINGLYDGSLFTINRIDQGVTRCRIDGLNVDHLNSGVEGPFGWIVKGTVDMLGDVRMPQNMLKLKDFFHLVGSEIYKAITATKDTPYESEYKQYYKEDDEFLLDLKMQLNNVKARIPRDVSYINYALIRPIIGYINSRQTYMDVTCKVVKSMKDFNGSWTIYDSKLMDDLSEKVYEAFGDSVIDEEKKKQRMRKVGFWVGQFVLQVVLIGFSL